jgi:formylglycine-generating enzyme required for sulfatase activity
MPGGFSIDATEVTRSQYDAWLATNPSKAGQPSACSFWNNKFDPDPDCMNKLGDCEGSTCDNFPVVCVDWCDAYAYCRGIGKRLCGKIGGGANESAEYADASKSQWYAACSSGGNNAFPYGKEYDGQACNGDQAGEDELVAVGSFRDCESPDPDYAGVFDLSGNVWEWEDSCEGNTGEKDPCRMRGGGYAEGGHDHRCNGGSTSNRNGHEFAAGFRCCSSP